jgi:cytochrome P450
VSEAVAYSPFSEAARRDPLPLYRALRDADPVHFIPEHEGWALARFADVWAAAEDAEHFATRAGTTAAQVLSRVEPPVPSVNQLDGPDHTRLRKALHPFFARHRVAELEAETRALARETLASARGGELDAARELAEPIAAHVACRVLDLPRAEAPRFQRWVARYMANAPGDLGRSPDALAAALEMNAWLAERVKERRSETGRDDVRIVDRFLAARVDGRPLADLEIASHLQTLVIGGTETTPKVIAAALLHLHQNPEQRAAILAGRASAADAFEEALRLDSPTQFMARTVARDLELHGKRLRAGQGVLLLYASANRDEREFAEPDRFDVLRRPRRMLGFGHGAHLCIGLHVARLEARVVLEEVLARAPRYAVDEAHVARVASDQMRGIASLPLRLAGE